MSSRLLDTMTDAAGWPARGPGGGATTLLQATVANTRLPDALGSGPRLQLKAQPGALGHFAEHTFAVPVDLSALNELRIWTNSTVGADGSDALPFFLRLRLASVAVTFDAPANTWVRMLPVSQVNVWQLLKVSLADLPAAIRSAVTAVRLEVSGTHGFVCLFDSLIGVDERVLADVEAALVAALDRQLTFKGVPIPASVYLPGGALPETPNIRISPAIVEYAPELSVQIDTRSDFTADGFALRPPPKGYQLYYDLEADGTDMADRAVLLDFALDRVTATALRVNGEYLPVDLVPIPIPYTTPPVRLPLRIRVRAWKSPSVLPATARPVRQLAVEGGAR